MDYILASSQRRSGGTHGRRFERYGDTGERAETTSYCIWRDPTRRPNRMGRPRQGGIDFLANSVKVLV